MDPIYLIIVIILLGLAVLDLTVGVANDAVNFLNSSIGSKVAPLWVILTVASVGVMLGTLFSNGMMEIARSGVFHPHMFTFPNIMMLLLAVMIADVILLDVFNSLGLPTSTTVSLIFELLGAAVAVALFSISQDGGGNLIEYINTGKALAIISGILVSIGIAFFFGSSIMYITRLIFSFNYKKPFRYFGALWCGFALTAMTYFIAFKGLRYSALSASEFLDIISQNMFITLLVTFVACSSFMALLQFAFKVNILKIIVLTGTLALALAFASNDLVNFIGIFIAGLGAYEAASEVAAAGGSIETLYMDALNGPVAADWRILLAAGLVMVLALWFSKKARTVIETEVNLGRQNSGVERFSSTPLSRSLVRGAVNLNRSLNRFVSDSLREKINSRFVLPKNAQADGESFDLIRASINLTIAALLISLATSLKLPLSTTYVTFMVAMGTSLADRAWGRESAVYRITGVLTVISGWFITAFVAFTIGFIVAAFLVWVGKIAIAILLALTVFALIKSSKFHTKRKSKEEANAKLLEDESGVVNSSTRDVKTSIEKMLNIYHKNIEGLTKENRSLLRNITYEADELYQTYKDKRTYEVVPTIQAIALTALDIEQEYVQIVDYTYEVSKALKAITSDSLLHIENNHKGLSDAQEEDLEDLSKNVTNMYHSFIEMMNRHDYSGFNDLLKKRDVILEQCAKYTKKQIRRVKANESGTRNSILFMNILNETKNIALQSGNLMKSQKNMILATNRYSGPMKGNI